MRVFGRVEEANGARVVARALDVAAEVRLPTERESPPRKKVIEANESALVARPGVEDFALGARPVVEVPIVTLDEDAAVGEPLVQLERRALLRGAGPQRSDEPPAQG